MKKNSYNSIIRSTGLIGFVHIVKLLTGFVRNKIVAIYWGPSGVGIWGLCTSWIEMLQFVSLVGMEKSVVKGIAEETNIKNRQRTIQISCLLLFASSILCMTATFLFSKSFSLITFGSDKHQAEIVVCGFVAIFTSASILIGAVLNGLRELKSLALFQLSGIIIGNLFVYFMIPYANENYAPYLLLLNAVFLTMTGVFAFARVSMSWEPISLNHIGSSISNLFEVGGGVWVTSMSMAVMTYMVNLLIRDSLGTSVLGMYLAGWSVSSMFIGILLSSMSAGYFPEICAAKNDLQKSTAIINSQVEFGLLISFPIVCCVYCFGEFILSLLYSDEFSNAASMLRWLMSGVSVRLLGYPLSYALLAKGKMGQYVISQFVFQILNYCTLWLLVALSDDRYLGASFFFSYLIYIVLTYYFCKRSYAFNFSRFVYLLISLYAIAAIILSRSFFRHGVIGVFVGFTIILASITFSLYQFKMRSGIDFVEIFRQKFFK